MKLSDRLESPTPRYRGGSARHSSSTFRSSRAIRAGSARKSTSTIFLFLTVKAPTEKGLPSRIVTIPGAPFTRACRMVRSTCDDHQSAWPATAVAPRTCRERSVRSPPSARSTTSGSRTPTSASKSPPRAAARNASTISHWAVRSGSGTRAAPRTRRRAEVLDLARVGAAKPQPGVLDRVVGLAERAEHPVGDRAEMWSLLLELAGEPFLLIHVTFLPHRVSWT